MFASKNFYFHHCTKKKNENIESSLEFWRKFKNFFLFLSFCVLRKWFYRIDRANISYEFNIDISLLNTAFKKKLNKCVYSNIVYKCKRMWIRPRRWCEYCNIFFFFCNFSNALSRWATLEYEHMMDICKSYINYMKYTWARTLVTVSDRRHRRSDNRREFEHVLD